MRLRQNQNTMRSENSNVQDRVIRICEDVLLWEVRPSGTWCRHSFATNLRNAGVDINYISESMGHSTANNSVTELYIEHYPLEKQEADGVQLFVVEYRKGKEKQQRRIAKSTINPVGRRVKRFVGFREKDLA